MSDVPLLNKQPLAAAGWQPAWIDYKGQILMALCAYAQLLKMRCGLHWPDGQGMTLILTEQVRQLEELAISKLKRHNDSSRTFLVIAGGRVQEWGCYRREVAAACIVAHKPRAGQSRT